MKQPPSWNGNATPSQLNPSEHQICKAFAEELLRVQPQYHNLLYWTHVDNGQRAGASVQSRKIAGGLAKQEGTKAGHPDYYFLYRAFHGKNYKITLTIAYIEMKTPKAGKKLTGAQKDFQDMCATNGVKHAVCTSAQEAMGQLKAWGVIC